MKTKPKKRTKRKPKEPIDPISIQEFVGGLSLKLPDWKWDYEPKFYFRFPLTVLAVPPQAVGHDGLFNLLIHYGIVGLSKGIRRKDTNKRIRNVDFSAVELPEDFNPRKRSHKYAAVVLDCCNMDCPSIGGLFGTWKDVEAFRRENDLDGDNVMVDLNLSKLIKWREHRYIDERDVRILAAIRSCLGSKRFDLIRRTQIRTRAFGAETGKRFDHVLKLWKPNVFEESEIVTPDSTIIRKLAKLERYKFFKRYVVDNRNTYFGKGSMTYGDLEDEVRAKIEKQKHPDRAMFLESTTKEKAALTRQSNTLAEMVLDHLRSKRGGSLKNEKEQRERWRREMRFQIKGNRGGYERVLNAVRYYCNHPDAEYRPKISTPRKFREENKFLQIEDWILRQKRDGHDVRFNPGIPLSRCVGKEEDDGGPLVEDEEFTEDDED